MISLSQKTVEEFFQNSNWQGIKLVEAPRKNEASDGQESFFQPHLSLTVEEYFSGSNWRGLAVDTTINSSVEDDRKISPLQMSVSEFFQTVVWMPSKTIKKNIATTITNQPSKSTTVKNKPQFNVQDLSDLL